MSTVGKKMGKRLRTCPDSDQNARPLKKREKWV